MTFVGLRGAQILRKFEGIHSFHNFTRLKLRDIIDRRAKAAAAANAAEGVAVASAAQIDKDGSEEEDEDEEHEEEEEDEAGDEDESNNDAANRQLRSKQHRREGGSRQVFDDWEPEQHPIAGKQKVLCTLYTCAAKDWLQLEGRDFIKITLRGQSFLLNQIRMMVSCNI